MKIKSKLKSILTLSLCLLLVGGIYLYNNKVQNYNSSSGVIYSYNIYDNKDTFLSESDLIIRGNVTETTTKEINIASTNTDPIVIEYKIVSILVTDVIKGDAEIGDNINIKYPARDDIGIHNMLDSLLNINSDCLVFLNSYEQFGSNMPYSLVSPRQSVIKFNNDEYFISYSQNNSVNLFNDIHKENLVDYLKEYIK